MLITIPTAGTRGDVQPAIALGLGLIQAGYQVRLMAFEEYRELVTAYGLNFYPLQVNMQALLEKHGKANLFDSGAIQIFFIPLLIRIFKELYEQMTRDMLEAASGTSTEEVSIAILGSPANAMLAHAVAEKLEAAYIETSGFPGWPTRCFPSFFWPGIHRPCDGSGLRGRLNRLSYTPVGWMANLGMLPVVNRCREEILGLPRVRSMGNYGGSVPALAFFSKHVLPRPADWGDSVHVTGYWFVDTPDYIPPPELKRFLEGGTPPVYIGFGSMPSRDSGKMTDLVTRALQLSGQRGLLLTSSGLLGKGLAQKKTAQDILAIGSTPHDWLFPHCAAVVHHGGAGTTASGLRAGIPSILIPMMGDQLLWAQRIEELGAGPKPILRSRLTAERLAEAITRAVTDPGIRQRATALGEKIRSEDGVGNAVKIIDQHITEHLHQTSGG